VILKTNKNILYILLKIDHFDQFITEMI